MEIKSLAKALDAGKYEHAEKGGLILPASRTVLQGIYFHSVNDGPVVEDRNLIVNEGLIYMLVVSLMNGTKLPAWYLSLFAGNVTPAPEWTAASYPATASEITDASEGYTEPTRPQWVPPGTISEPIVDNIASRAVFTIATASSLTVNGVAMHSESTKGAVSGTLFSATKLATPRVLYDTDTFTVGYRIQLVSA